MINLILTICNLFLTISLIYLVKELNDLINKSIDIKLNDNLERDVRSHVKSIFTKFYKF